MIIVQSEDKKPDVHTVSWGPQEDECKQIGTVVWDRGSYWAVPYYGGRIIRCVSLREAVQVTVSLVTSIMLEEMLEWVQQ